MTRDDSQRRTKQNAVDILLMAISQQCGLEFFFGGGDVTLRRGVMPYRRFERIYCLYL